MLTDRRVRAVLRVYDSHVRLGERLTLLASQWPRKLKAT